MRPGVLLGALSLFMTAGAAGQIPAPFPPSSNALPPAPPAPPAAPAPPASASPSPQPNDIRGLLTAALPADGTADVVLVDWPASPGSPHVRAATIAAAAPAAIKGALMDAGNYRKIVPALLRADVSKSPAGLAAVDWEVGVAL